MVTSNVRLIRLLGQGGMGSVWVAEHLGLDTEVAVKFVDVQATKDPKVLARFKREAGTAAKLKSPHAVQTFDHGVSADGTPYIVMELLEGESLQDKLARDRTLSLRECTLVVMQTAHVLTKAHKMGVVHRDLKPANLFLVDTGYELFVKLLDFGIAKHAGGITEVGLTKTGTLLGSPLYMSPEQFVNVKGIDHRGDLWSLAVLVYQCLSGTHAFKGETLGQVIIAVTNCKYQPITAIRKSLPLALDAFFERAFHCELEKRFQTAKELADAFAAAARSAEKEPSSDVTGPRAALPSLTDIPLEATTALPDGLAAQELAGLALGVVQGASGGLAAGAVQRESGGLAVGVAQSEPGRLLAGGLPGAPSALRQEPTPVAPVQGLAAGASAGVASSPVSSGSDLAAPLSGHTAELTDAAGVAPMSGSPAMMAEQAQTFSPAATTLDQEPAGKRSRLLVAVAGIVALAGVTVAVVMGGFGGAAVPVAPDSSVKVAEDTEPPPAVDEPSSEPASEPVAEAESSDAAEPSGEAALAEGDEAMPAASASASASVSAEPADSAVAGASSSNSGQASLAPTAKPSLKPKPVGQGAEDYAPDMGF